MSADDEDLSLAELAATLGVGARTVERWAAEDPDGFPRWQDARSGTWRYSRAQVLAWRDALEAAGRRVGTGAGRAGGKGRPEGPTAAPAPARAREVDAGFLEAIDQADDLTAIIALQRRAIRAQLERRITAAEGTAILRHLDRLQDNLDARRRATQGSEALVSEEAVRLAQTFDVLVSEARRGRVLALAEELLEEERAAFPGEDPAAARAALEAEGLDGFGAEEGGDGDDGGDGTDARDDGDVRARAGRGGRGR